LKSPFNFRIKSYRLIKHKGREKPSRVGRPSEIIKHKIYKCKCIYSSIDINMKNIEFGIN